MELKMREGYEGTGPGAITPDGCAVEFYALLPAGNEPEIIHSAIREGASVLDLGAGTGRITHPLIKLAHKVVAVDESPAMLERIHGAQTVCSPIQTLDLQRRFDAVLLASHLVNTPDDELRRGFLEACSRHVANDGCVVIQRHDPAWFSTAGPSQHTDGEITFSLRDVSRPALGLLAATMDYRVGDRTWTHTFTARCIDDAQLAHELTGVGLAVNAYLTQDKTWVRAMRC
jgi:SAM-dependent methyltransferase